VAARQDAWILAASIVYSIAAVLGVFVVRRIEAAQSGFLERSLAPPPRPDVVPV
jgi:hypothetical protein